jgi:hypothetical protein
MWCLQRSIGKCAPMQGQPEGVNLLMMVRLMARRIHS